MAEPVSLQGPEPRRADAAGNGAGPGGPLPPRQHASGCESFLSVVVGFFYLEQYYSGS